MKFSITAAVGLGVAVLATAAVGQDNPKGAGAATGAAPAAAAGELKDDQAKLSYAIGQSLGNNFKAQSIDVDPEALARGLKDAVTGAKPLLTDEQMREVMLAFQAGQRQRQMEAMKNQADQAKKAGDKVKADGEAFLAENKKKPGVVTLPSGLQYKVVKEGTGKIPKATDKIKAHYRGTLIDGTEFDSSYKGGKPLDIDVNGVIPGWTEALMRMKVGSKWQLFIPSELAYGPNPPGPPIQPNSALLFDIELIGID